MRLQSSKSTSQMILLTLYPAIYFAYINKLNVDNFYSLIKLNRIQLSIVKKK